MMSFFAFVNTVHYSFTARITSAEESLSVTEEVPYAVYNLCKNGVPIIQTADEMIPNESGWDTARLFGHSCDLARPLRINAPSQGCRR